MLNLNMAMLEKMLGDNFENNQQINKSLVHVF